jgi:hypothetical protein
MRQYKARQSHDRTGQDNTRLGQVMMGQDKTVQDWNQVMTGQDTKVKEKNNSWQDNS